MTVEYILLPHPFIGETSFVFRTCPSSFLSHVETTPLLLFPIISTPPGRIIRLVVFFRKCYRNDTVPGLQLAFPSWFFPPPPAQLTFFPGSCSAPDLVRAIFAPVPGTFVHLFYRSTCSVRTASVFVNSEAAFGCILPPPRQSHPLALMLCVVLLLHPSLVSFFPTPALVIFTQFSVSRQVPTRCTVSVPAFLSICDQLCASVTCVDP